MEFLPEGGQHGCRTGDQITKRTRRNHSPAFKAKVALAAVKGEKTLAEPAIDVKTLDAKIGELTLVNDFCPGRSARIRDWAGLLPSAKTMIERSHALPVARQARELGISRGSVYYLPRPTSATDLAIMRRIDPLHMEFPFAGSRMLRHLLAAEGIKVGRLHVSTLMKKMAIEAIYRRPNTSKPAPGHKIYPYLLRKLAVTRPNKVWATDITYIPMARGFVYLIAIVDWFSRRVLSWQLSITLETDFCIEALEEALTRFGAPEIFNTDQDSQFTSMAFTAVLQREKIAISMDGRGAWRDNVFVERLWRSVKYEEVYLRAHGSVSEARASIGR